MFTIILKIRLWILLAEIIILFPSFIIPEVVLSVTGIAVLYLVLTQANILNFRICETYVHEISTYINVRLGTTSWSWLLVKGDNYRGQEDALCTSGLPSLGLISFLIKWDYQVYASCKYL